MLHKKFAKLHSVSGSEPNSQKIVMYSEAYLTPHRPHGDRFSVCSWPACFSQLTG